MKKAVKADMNEYAAVRLCIAAGDVGIYRKEGVAYLVHMPPQLALVIKTLIENFHHLDKIKSTQRHMLSPSSTTSKNHVL